MALVPSSPSFSSASILVDEQRGSDPPVRYLRALPQYGVLLYTEHQTYYTPQNIREHLLRKHAIKGKLAKEIQVWIKSQEIIEVELCPLDYSLFIPGLAHKEGFIYNAVTYNSRTIS